MLCMRKFSSFLNLFGLFYLLEDLSLFTFICILKHELKPNIFFKNRAPIGRTAANTKVTDQLMFSVLKVDYFHF